MYAPHDLNGATFAHAVLTTSELVATLPRSATRPAALADPGSIA